MTTPRELIEEARAEVRALSLAKSPRILALAARIERLATALEAALVDRERFGQLRAFAQEMVLDWNHDGYCGDIDGGEFQECAVKYGVLIAHRVEKPCDSPAECVCEEFGFPTDCHRLAPDLHDAIRTARSAEEGTRE